MASLTDVTGGNTAQASDVQQVVAAMKGTAGQGVPVAFTALNDAINFALAVKNNDAGASKGLVVYNSAGTVMLQVDKNGVIFSPDGVAGASQAVTLTGTQTLTSKTLTTPVLNGQPTGTGFGAWTAFAPTLDQGGTVTATVNLAHYQIIGKTALVQMTLTATAAGGVSSAILIKSIPAAIAPLTTGGATVCGSFYYSGASTRSGVVVQSTATQLAFFVDNSGAAYLGATPAVTLANGHVLSCLCTWELA